MLRYISRHSAPLVFAVMTGAKGAVQSGMASSSRENASDLMLVSASASGMGVHFSSRNINALEGLVKLTLVMIPAPFPGPLTKWSPCW